MRSGVTRLDDPAARRVRSRWGPGSASLGYRTAAIGKMHFNGPSHARFDTADRLAAIGWTICGSIPRRGGDHRRPWRPFVDPPAVWLNADCQDDGPARRVDAVDVLRRSRDRLPEGSTGDRPFAMVVSFYDPHCPFHFPREWQGRLPCPSEFSGPAGLGSRPRGAAEDLRALTPDDSEGIQAAYYTSLSFVDCQIGRLIQGLDETGSRTGHAGRLPRRQRLHARASTVGSRSTASTSRPCGSR